MIQASIFLLCSLLFQSGAGSATVQVEVELNRPEAGGMVRFALCRGEKAYKDLEGCTSYSVEASSNFVKIVIKDLQPGEYGIKAFHDINENGKMDFNMIGIPTEPYGFSNNARATFSEPAFDQASFTVEPGRNVTRFKMKG